MNDEALPLPSNEVTPSKLSLSLPALPTDTDAVTLALNSEDFCLIPYRRLIRLG